MTFAHWKKCDFQVHTPRDPNWTGVRPIGLGKVIPEASKIATVTDVDALRLKWANEFVDQCIAKALQAIALTDHHEMVMVPYVRQVIAERRNTDPAFDLWLFPGMELTASGGKQCLIIFDADLSDDWCRQAQGKLGIAYADLDEKAAISPKVTQLAINYADLARELDTIKGLRGRYIILPNVSQGNKHTVLVDGAHGDFRRMPYIGGYLDQGQTIDTLGNKNRTRLSGTDKTWSVREIYPLPTSDSRSADSTKLGQNNTWMKLAEPTVEAIRQAFLGHRSRICIVPPQTPSLAVSGVQMAGSTILRDTTLPLSPELNSAIGGRGSGKSSLLEYLSFGLGRSCHDFPRDHYSGTERLSELVNDTFVSKGGRVTLTIIQDGAVFKVERGQASAYQPQVTYPNGDTQTVTVKELRALFPAVVYSQGELAEIGKQAGKKTQLTDLLQFVNPDYKREDDRLSQDIETAKSTVRSAIQQLTSHWHLQAKLRQLKTSWDSLTQRVKALEKTLPKQSEEDQATIAYFDKANEFDSKRIQASKHADQILGELNSAATELLNERSLNSDLTGAEPDAIRQAYGDLYKTFSDGINKILAELKAKHNTLTVTESTWANQLKKARDERDAVLEKLSEHKTVTAQIIKLREEITDLTNQIGDLEAELKAAGDPAAALQKAVSTLKETNHKRTERTQDWANEIETLSSGKIRAVVDPNGDTSEICDAMDVVASKTGSQEATRIKGLEEALAAAPTTDVTDRLRMDCLSLLYWRQIGSASGEEQPKCAELMTVLGDTEKIRSALTERIDAARVEAISTAVAKPEIDLSYCDGDREISFEKASEGQRAAALLFMLLEQPGGPLIIDQPEGDLDNKIITDLTEKLHNAKQKRQLIFASHNANIVVNGSSELVAHLDIDESGERKIACAGAIDKPEICGVITATMEGGEKAFKDRQDKYGY
ncbi:TrlF family AAA-like ATPase [Hyphobacterium indicum]|uniref:TrlF family AAA-like ATPase n=1 Tax=Hyphobacterium indicum TaxID=2162714 RepID=UPI000D65C68B|nr:AAA family ATPase [Hyphobacterium indicum]